VPTDRPSVSAVITAYNSARFIADAVASIRAQRSPPTEIIIVDDGSTDGTNTIVRELGADIRYVWQPNGGEAAARNHGIALAQGDTVGFLDADDAWPGDRLEKLLPPLEDPRADIVCGRARAFSEDQWTAAAAASAADHREGFLMSFGCALIRRAVFERVGKVDETMRHGVDLDWFLRCREQNVPIVVIEDVVLLYRRHDQNMTRNIEAGREGLMRTVKQSLDRRRRGQETVQSLPQWETLGRDRS
jgi:glycosyltransferase involved in cell wall biosynthesis